MKHLRAIDGLRAIAVLAVVAYHAGLPVSAGFVGVDVFFVISGYLITRLLHDEVQTTGRIDFWAFYARRARRILPALVLTVVLSAFVLGPLVSALSTGSYLRSSVPAHYVVDNVLAVSTADVVGDLAFRLPGVFTTNETSVVNGSLWTLPVEIRAYLLILVLGITGLLLRRLWVVVAAGLVLLALPASAAGWTGVGRLVEFRDSHPDPLLLAIFGVGALLYVQRGRVPLRLPLAAAALAAWALATWGLEGAQPLANVLVALAVPYLVIFAAYEAPRRVRGLTRPGDVSYGVYLLAFPVGQTIVYLAGRDALGPLALLVIAFPVTYLLALLSWRVIEQPALSLKRRM